MASRFLVALKKVNENLKINLSGECDIIIDDVLAIECKYVHSVSNMVKNIRKADNQISKRIKNGEAKKGLIALDLSNILPRSRIDDFVDFTFSRYVENYEILEKSGKLEGNILEQVLSDKNFYKIISNYITSELETALYNELGFEYKFEPYTKAIIFQSVNSFVFEYKGNILPLTTRGMTYFIDKKINKDAWADVKSFIHLLAVGL